jgi:glycosyltransferase involved in cell wall biosynthesis
MKDISKATISIIVPVFNDVRVVDSILSVHDFDDIDTTIILIIDGGSSPEVLNLIKNNLRVQDVLISERDRGIFDALNKGLALCETEFIGWLGSDDRFTGNVKASDVSKCLQEADLFIASTAHFVCSRVIRISHSFSSHYGLVRFGLNNPHFSTFGRSELLKSETFKLNLRGSDIDYFLRIFEKKPKVICSSEICTVMAAGGYSNSNYSAIIKTNLELLNIYGRNSSYFFAPFALIIKLSYKLLSSFFYKIFPKKISTLKH